VVHVKSVAGETDVGQISFKSHQWTSLNPCKIHATGFSSVNKINSVAYIKGNSQLNKYVIRNYIIRTIRHIICYYEIEWLALLPHVEVVPVSKYERRPDIFLLSWSPVLA
jgi:hypothetical protein